MFHIKYCCEDNRKLNHLHREPLLLFLNFIQNKFILVDYYTYYRIKMFIYFLKHHH